MEGKTTIFQVEHFSLPRQIESLAVFALTLARCSRFQVAQMLRVLLFPPECSEKCSSKSFPAYSPRPLNSPQVLLFLLETLAKETLNVHCILLSSNSASSAGDAGNSHFPGDDEQNHHSNDQRQKKPGSPIPPPPKEGSAPLGTSPCSENVAHSLAIRQTAHLG